MMKRQRKIIASILAAAFLIGGTTCYAGSVSTSLSPNQTSVETAILGNTTGTYRFTSTNGKTSMYAVEAYLYAGSNSSNITYEAKKHTMSPDLQAHSDDVGLSRKYYTVAKACTYGNTKKQPKTGCVASTQIRNV